MGEELRVLYVALTRAMEKMIISGSCKDVDKALEKNKDNPNFLDIRSCNSYLDMILLSFDNVHFDIRKYDYTMLLKEEKETQKEVGDLHKVFESIDIKEHNILKNRLDYVYPYFENIDLKTKFSVSEIKKLSQSEEFEIKDVKRAKSNSSDASERGNAYHKLLQKMHYENIGKFSDIKDFIREEISLLKNKKYRELIDIDDIVKFLNTNLGGEFVKQHQNLKRENQFIMGLSAKEAGMGSSDETILIQGVIDAYIENENGIILVDYKTDNVNNEDVLINRYRSQLMLYKKSLEMSTGKTVQTVYIYSFALGKEISLK